MRTGPRPCRYCCRMYADNPGKDHPECRAQSRQRTADRRAARIERRCPNGDHFHDSPKKFDECMSRYERAAAEVRLWLDERGELFG